MDLLNVINIKKNQNRPSFIKRCHKFLYLADERQLGFLCTGIDRPIGWAMYLHSEDEIIKRIKADKYRNLTVLLWERWSLSQLQYLNKETNIHKKKM